MSQNRYWTALLAMGVAFASSIAAVAHAGGFLITVSPGSQDLPLALPKTQGQGDLSSTLWAQVKRDLDMSGYFNIIDPNAYIEQNKGVEPGQFDFNDWRTVKAAALAKTRVATQDNGLRADVYIYDVNAGVKIDAKGFAGNANQARYLAHRLSDAILVALTGQHGIFGSRLAAVGSGTGHKEIYLLDMDGQGITPVTSNSTINLSPAWSPHADKVAWTSYKRGNPDLYIKDLASGKTSVLSARPGINTGATYSPDGSKVALARTDPSGDSDIFIIDAATGADVGQVTRGGGIDVAPNWSADGSKLAYASERSGGSQVYVQDLGSGTATRVTFEGGMNGDPVFSPDGSKIAFVGRDQHFDIFVINVDGTGLVRLTQDMGDNEDPCWSPDGRYLVFSSTRTGKANIWLSTADGRHQQAVTESGGWTQPTWMPW